MTLPNGTVGYIALRLGITRDGFNRRGWQISFFFGKMFSSGWVLCFIAVFQCKSGSYTAKMYSPTTDIENDTSVNLTETWKELEKVCCWREGHWIIVDLQSGSGKIYRSVQLQCGSDPADIQYGFCQAHEPTGTPAQLILKGCSFAEHKLDSHTDHWTYSILSGSDRNLTGILTVTAREWATVTGQRQ